MYVAPLRKLFGVSWRTHETQRVRIRELEAITESLSKSKSAEISTKHRFEALYNREKENHDSCARERRDLQGERETLMEINRNLAKELHRIRELFMVAFTSKQAEELVLQNRRVHLKHLRQLTGVTKFSAEHVVAALKVANREADGKGEGMAGD